MTDSVDSECMIVLLLMVLQAEAVDNSVDDMRLGRCFDISVVDVKRKKVYWLLIGCSP
jgi:hypothetical protein